MFAFHESWTECQRNITASITVDLCYSDIYSITRNCTTGKIIYKGITASITVVSSYNTSLSGCES